MMEKMYNKIQVILDEATANIFDIYYILYTECICGQDNPEILLGYILNKVQGRQFEDSGEPINMEYDLIEETKFLYTDLLRECVISLVRKNLSEAEFYENLYKIVFQSAIFPEDKKSQSVLLYLLSEKVPGIPYFQAVNLLQMTAEEYKGIVKRLDPEINRALDVLNRRYKSRTEEASQIYEIFSSIEKREEKIVFLSVYTNIIQESFKEKE